MLPHQEFAFESDWEAGSPHDLGAASGGSSTALPGRDLPTGLAIFAPRDAGGHLAHAHRAIVRYLGSGVGRRGGVPHTLQVSQVRRHLMETGGDVEGNLMLQKTMPLGPVDPKSARFPCCIVWTPLPFISWLIPFIGHVGICREDGVILDFAGPNFVCVDHFTFGAVARYIQLDRKKVAAQEGQGQTISSEELTWDDALRKSTQEYQHRSYNLFTCNCHSFVANNLNRMCYGGRDNWNVVNLATWIFIRGTWVNRRALLRSFLPFLVVLCTGILLRGSTFLSGLLLFSLALVSWFVLGTYCFKSLIQL